MPSTTVRIAQPVSPSSHSTEPPPSSSEDPPTTTIATATTTNTAINLSRSKPTKGNKYNDVLCAKLQQMMRCLETYFELSARLRDSIENSERSVENSRREEDEWRGWREKRMKRHRLNRKAQSLRMEREKYRADEERHRLVYFYAASAWHACCLGKDHKQYLWMMDAVWDSDL